MSTTSSEIQALFAQGLPEHDVYIMLANKALHELAADIAAATAKATDDPNTEEFRAALVLDQVAEAALRLSAFTMAELDSDYTLGTLADLIEAVESDLECYVKEESTTPNRALN